MIYTFFKHQSIKTITIVTNRGQIKFITKTDNINDIEVRKLCAKYFSNLNVYTENHIENLLKQIYNMNMIKFKVR